MTRILLLDSNQTHARDLALALKRHRCSVTICASRRDAIIELKRNSAGFDVVILDLSANRPEDWATFDQIQKLTWMSVPTPMIVCFSTIYRGPKMNLEVERRGARFVYER
jgi:DNA-binding response OmpR family regulator